MANFLTISDFVDEIQLHVSSIRSTDFDSFLTRKQSDFLRKVLGVELSEDFISGLGEDPILEKWTKLKDGANFVYAGETYYFEGIKNSLKNYCYIKWQQQNSSTNVDSGNVINKQENSYLASVATRLRDSSYQCLSILEMMKYFIEVNEDDYPDWLYVQPIGLINQFGI